MTKVERNAIAMLKKMCDARSKCGEVELNNADEVVEITQKCPLFAYCNKAEDCIMFASEEDIYEYLNK